MSSHRFDIQSKWHNSLLYKIGKKERLAVVFFYLTSRSSRIPSLCMKDPLICISWIFVLTGVIAYYDKKSNLKFVYYLSFCCWYTCMCCPKRQACYCLPFKIGQHKKNNVKPWLCNSLGSFKLKTACTIALNRANKQEILSITSYKPIYILFLIALINMKSRVKKSG